MRQQNVFYTTKGIKLIFPLHLKVVIWYSKREMNKAADSTTKSPDKPAPVSMGTIALDLLNTAWRIAVPVLIFSVAGIFADKHWHTAPWITLLGLVVGFVFAGLLIKQQISIVNKREAL